ncbi:MAG: hypothetical protein VKJ85_00825, partial [Prochlorothrix sp.]|nr:hypothetical protein [Prochlorothrix sp.]
TRPRQELEPAAIDQAAQPYLFAPSYLFAQPYLGHLDELWRAAKPHATKLILTWFIGQEL